MWRAGFGKHPRVVATGWLHHLVRGSGRGSRDSPDGRTAARTQPRPSKPGAMKERGVGAMIRWVI